MIAVVDLCTLIGADSSACLSFRKDAEINFMFFRMIPSVIIFHDIDFWAIGWKEASSWRHQVFIKWYTSSNYRQFSQGKPVSPNQPGRTRFMALMMWA